MANSTTTATKAEPSAFRLVDDFTGRHLKFAGREPRTLAEVLIARADYEHKRRIAELRVMGKKLEQLDPFLPALAERGIKLQWRDISSTDSGKTLRIYGPLMGSDNALCDALIALGFKEVDRKDSFRDEQTVTLKHGRALLVAIDVKKSAAPSADKAVDASLALAA